MACASHADVPVIPRPQVEQNPDGSALKGFREAKSGFRIDLPVAIEAPDSLKNEKENLEEFDRQFWSGIRTEASGTNRIVLSLDEALPSEGYRMQVTDKGIAIAGGSPAGVFYGIQSLKQMVLADADQVKAGKQVFIPAMTLEDAPSTVWRGVMLDTARHYMPKEFIKKFIDVVSVYKLNRLHWHLVDSEAWRLEIKKYPKLVEVAEGFPLEYPSEDPTVRSRPAKFMYGDFHGGGYYTQDDVREIVAYAKARHIEIMPEIEFPGHAMAALTAYPEFGTTGKVPVIKSNHSPDLFAPNEKALGFLRDVLDETMELFPFEVIHFGGDEAPKVQWKESKEAQDKIKELGLNDENELQAWMFNELAAHIKKKGRRPAGWEEIMHGHNMETLTKDAIVMPWLSAQNAVKSANAGLGVIHSQTGMFYLDSWQTDSPADNWTLYRGPLTLKKLYNFNLYPEGLTEEGRKNILGAQCFLWTELLTKPEHVEYQGFPRLTSFAEMMWTKQERKDYEDYYERLIRHIPVLDAYKVNYRYINPLPVAKWDAGKLKKGKFTVTLPEDTVKGLTGEMIVQFDYTGGGSGLEIKKVEFANDGKVIATDEHDGFTGAKKNDNTYRLKYGDVKLGKSELIITHGNARGKTDSQGDITVFSGKGLELFDPKNFIGGDYPSASWTTGDTKSEESDVRIYMDGIVRKDGPHELIINLKQAKSPVVVGNVRVTGTAGGGSVFNVSATVDEKNKTAILPIDLKKGDLALGNSMLLGVKSANPSSADVRVRLTKDFPGTDGKKYKWNPELFADGGIIAYAREVLPTGDGVIKLKFNYTGGGNAMEIKGVQVIDNGLVIAESDQNGSAGANPKDNAYTLESSKIQRGKKYSLRMIVAGMGGNDTNGELVVE